ncbi:MAG: hypothetical protein K2O66_06865, partial [Bacteroidales bacterium]|nr:hypothetical protein [Bacteroidales bacterium]
TKTLDFIRPFLAMAKSKQAWLLRMAYRKRWISSDVFSPWQNPSKLGFCAWLNENVGFHPTFSRHGKIQASLASAHGLSKTLDFIRRFLAMAKSKQAWLLRMA